MPTSVPHTALGTEKLNDRFRARTVETKPEKFVKVKSTNSDAGFTTWVFNVTHLFLIQPFEINVNILFHI